MEFFNALDSSETINGISSVSYETLDGVSAGLSISQTGIATGVGPDSLVEMVIANGSDGETYRIEVLVTTSTSQTLEGDGILFVSDKR
tara:strand:+ start:294 stop:557 length:264 start_codon:yes stop_codon:yes gene_type:complete